MKTKFLISGALAVVVSSLIVLADTPAKKGLVVHEWGTFTSVQGGDGNLLNWKPLVTSELPRFVYNWRNAGLNRVPFYNPLLPQQVANGLFNKGGMVTLQRMETPVVYFYSDKPLTADLSVQFPAGLITEWFPQARQIGPSVVPPSKTLTGMDTLLHKCGAPAKFSLASAFSAKPVSNSMIHWSGIRVLGANAHEPLPTDTNGSHYFAARETDANLLQLDSFSPTNSRAQYEKFLFYRGVASFATPLRVTMKSDDAVTLTNTGSEPLAHLFMLDVKDKSGAFVYVARLLPGETKTVPRATQDTFLTPADLTAKLSRKMSAALVKEGLYPREAAAMVNTWQSSWFAEDGTRILYVLPRAWTDRTLPMAVNPAPRELTRVMVGRTEVLTPGLEQNLTRQLNKARLGDSAAITRVHQIAKSTGRFAEPAYFQTISKMKLESDDYGKLFAIFFSNNVPAFE